MDKGSCPVCDQPYGVRKRCYYCTAPNKRSGEVKPCAQCDKPFYAARWQLADTARRQGTYCSKACRLESIRLNGPGCKVRRKDGYISVYFPSHPDADRGGRILEHRLVAGQKYGRRILPTEHVNHINGIRDDNRPENLEVVTPSIHAGISNKQGAAQRAAMRARLKEVEAKLAEYERRFGPLE